MRSVLSWLRTFCRAGVDLCGCLPAGKLVRSVLLWLRTFCYAGADLSLVRTCREVGMGPSAVDRLVYGYGSLCVLGLRTGLQAGSGLFLTQVNWMNFQLCWLLWLD